MKIIDQGLEIVSLEYLNDTIQDTITYYYDMVDNCNSYIDVRREMYSLFDDLSYIIPGWDLDIIRQVLRYETGFVV